MNHRVLVLQAAITLDIESGGAVKLDVEFVKRQAKRLEYD